MTDKCFHLLKDLEEISGFIYDSEYETFDQLEQLIRMEFSKKVVSYDGISFAGKCIIFFYCIKLIFSHM